MNTGSFRHRVTLSAPSDPVPDGDGGYTESWGPLSPAEWDCSIQPATTRALENLAAGTVVSQASHIVTGRYHPGITTETRVTFENRTLEVLAVTNRDERDIETQLVCSEVVA